MNELDRQEEEVLVDGVYVDVDDVERIRKGAMLGLALTWWMVGVLEARGVAPAATRAMRMMLPPVTVDVRRDDDAAAP